MKKESYVVAILGATGAVGQEMLKVLQEYNIPVSELRPLARYVFDYDDYESAMRSRAFRDSPDDVIEGIAKSNLAAYDEIGRM